MWGAPPVDHSPVRTRVPCLPCFLSSPHGARHTVLAQPWFPLGARPPGTWSGPVLSVTWVVFLTPHSRCPPHPLTHSLCLGPSVALWMEAVKGVWVLARSQWGRAEGTLERPTGPMLCGRPQPGRCAVGQPLQLLCFIFIALMPWRTKRVCTGAKIEEKAKRREEI